MRINFRKSFFRGVARARADASGAVAVLFALALLPIMMAVGAAVDYGSATQMRTLLTNGLDSATLSVAVAHASGQTPMPNGGQEHVNRVLTREVDRVLSSNLGTLGTRVQTTVAATSDSTGAISSTAHMTFNTKFMRIAGVSTMQVTAESKVSVPGGPIEVAMVLDTTGSMAGAKIDGLKQAANTLATTLFAAPNAAANVKVAVVPFTYYVNIGLANRNATWLAGAQDYSVPRTGCWDTYPNAVYSNPVTVNATCYSDGAPYDCSWTNYQSVNLGAPVQQCGSWNDTYTWYGCVGSRAYPSDLQDKADQANPVPALLNYGCSTQLQRLTGSLPTVQSQINALTAGGETYIATGLLWGWRALSPYTPFADGAAYGSRTGKYMIVMTDGANTHSPNYPDHENSDVVNANTLTSQTCDAIKAKGIKIYTVAFAVTDAAIKNILRNCATNAAGYYDSASVADLQTAFVSIGNSITAVRLIR